MSNTRPLRLPDISIAASATAAQATLPSLADEEVPERTPTNPNGWRRQATPTPLTPLEPVDPDYPGPFHSGIDDTIVALPAAAVFTQRPLPDADKASVTGKNTGPETQALPAIGDRPTCALAEVRPATPTQTTTANNLPMTAPYVLISDQEPSRKKDKLHTVRLSTTGQLAAWVAVGAICALPFAAIIFVLLHR